MEAEKDLPNLWVTNYVLTTPCGQDEHQIARTDRLSIDSELYVSARKLRALVERWQGYAQSPLTHWLPTTQDMETARRQTALLTRELEALIEPPKGGV